MRLPLLALAALLVLTACGPAPGRFRPEPTVAPVDAPLFSSDAEALAAAEEVYREYSAIADQVAADGGRAPERLRPLSTESWYEAQVETYSVVRESGRYAQGSKPVVDLEIQRWGETQVIAYVCHDYSAFVLLNQDGSVVPSDKPPFATFTVSFLLVSGSLRIDETRLWRAGDSCSF